MTKITEIRRQLEYQQIHQKPQRHIMNIIMNIKHRNKTTTKHEYYDDTKILTLEHKWIQG